MRSGDRERLRPRQGRRQGRRLALAFGGPYIQRMLWRVSPVRSRRSLPAGCIKPCQPTLVPRPPGGEGWLHEIKHDGYRILACKDVGRVTLWSRYGTNLTDRFPKVAEAVCSLPAARVLIDGEAVALRPDGHSDFAALRTKAGSAHACLVAFDILQLNAADLRQRPLEERRDKLSPLVAGVEFIQFSEALNIDGALVFAHACKLGLEGIVSKRAGSRYRSGNSRLWLKAKNPGFMRE